METLTIEITNQKALGLLHELEELHLIKVIKNDTLKPIKKLSEKYKGFLNKAESDDLNSHIENIKGEWNNI